MDDQIEERPLRLRLLDELDVASITLAELCCRCAVVLPSSGVAIQLSANGDTAVTEASDPGAERAADLEATLGEGPTIEALRSHNAVVATDLTSDLRWPQLAEGLTDAGYHAAIAVPLLVDATQLGALTAYYGEAGTVEPGMVPRVAQVARVLTGIVLALPVSATNGLADTISIAAAHQGRIHQAAGIVSVVEGCTIDEALVRLRAYAYGHEQLLADVADAVVLRGLRLT